MKQLVSVCFMCEKEDPVSYRIWIPWKMEPAVLIPYKIWTRWVQIMLQNIYIYMLYSHFSQNVGKWDFSGSKFEVFLELYSLCHIKKTY